MEPGKTTNHEGKTLQGWQIVDRHTKAVVSALYGNSSRARARADKLDNQYGAYRYGTETVWA